MSRFLRLGLQFTIAFVVAIGFWGIMIMLFEEKFIFFPTGYPGGPYEDARYVPGLRDVYFSADDGVKLHAWYAPADSPMATILMAHGNAGNISHRIELMRRLQRTGFNVFMYDYRGYGRSEGSPTEEGVYRDARGAYDAVVNELGVDPARLVLWGTSLGGAVAVDLATHRPAAALILESTFTSAKDVARSAYPFLPFSYFIRSKFDSYEKMKDLALPVLMMHGERDEVIPLELGQKLYAVAPSPKEFDIIAGSGHNDTFIVGGQVYLDRIRTFILRHIPLP